MTLFHSSRFRTFAILCVLLAAVGTVASAQTRSRIVGSVKDAKTGEALVGVNITVVGASVGAASDIDGNYIIVNVPVGTQTVQASLVGYTRKALTDVLVSADRVTTLDILLEPGDISVEEVVVTAQRNAVHQEVSNTQLVVTNEDLIEAAGIREVNAFLAKQPGISEDNGFISIRGGAADQTGTMVNGLSYNNAAVGNAETSIPLSAIDQVSVLSGGFNAEYGNFRSGLINVTTKSGAKDGYHGTFSYSKNTDHMKRFGPSFYDAKNPVLAPYLDADVAFVGTAAGWAGDTYRQGQSETFTGWNAVAAAYNVGKTGSQIASPLDFYLLSAWMFMATPDYEGLAKQGYTVSDAQKKLFAEHTMKETGSDYNFDGGFGGPVPFIGKYLGDATFYVSNNTTEKYYVMPVVRPTDFSSTTFGTIRSDILSGMTLTLNGLWKLEKGVSQVRPAFGDFPDASRDGGFMPMDNMKAFSKNHDYWFDPPFFSELNQKTLLTGLTVNHVLSASTFWELSLSYLNIADENPRHGDWRDTSVVTQFGPFPVDEMPYGKWQFASSHTVGGYKFPNYDVPAFSGLSYRFRGKEGDLYDNIDIDQYRAKFDIASQIDPHNYLKGGVEYNDIRLHHNFWEKWNPNAYNAFEFNYDRTPSQTGVYVQDQLNYSGMLANVGVRVDYYYGGGGKWPTGDPFATAALTPVPYGNDSTLFAYLASGRSYIWDQWLSYDSTHPGFLQPVKNHWAVSPRLGISFPITDRSKFYFNYGHFRSNPPYYSMFLLKYRYTKNGLYNMSNPNLEPPKTIQYELGVVYNFHESYTLKVSGYYKDVTGQNGDVRYVNSTGSVDYDSWANNNYQDVEGLEVSLTKQDQTWVTGSLNFDYRLSKSGLTGIETVTDVPITDIQANMYQGQETRFLPQPSLNGTVSLHAPEKWGMKSSVDDLVGDWGLGSALDALLGDWRLTVFGQWRAGSYSTWNPLGKLHVSNNIQWPDFVMFDAKLNKTFSVAGVKATLYVDVKNVFNIKTNILSKGYAFRGDADEQAYLASLHLPMYGSPEFDALRAANPGLYVAGDDEIGELRSTGKNYINDPDYPFWIFSNPRDIWFGVRVDF